MLLTIDVGNTQTVLGLYNLDSPATRADEGMLEHWRVSTDHDRSSDEHAVLLRSLLEPAGFSLDAVAGVAICCGVPRVLASLRDMMKRYVQFEAIVIEPGVRTGMAILYDNPREVGADRIANAVAAYDLYGGPTVVVDFGTSNNFDIISTDGEFLGGAIAPGIETSLEAMFGRAAALGQVPLIEPRHVIGKSTVEAIQSGSIYGFSGQIDGLVDRFSEELGTCTVVATGGLASLIAPVSSTIQYIEPFLTLHGLRIVYSRNR
jgi:type III pantothenate kinase